MFEILGGLSTIAVLVFGLIALLTPIWLYLTQKYTYETRRELQRTNKLLEQLIQQQATQVVAVTAPEPPAEDVTPSNTIIMTCKHCKKVFKYGISHSGKEKPCPGCKKMIILQ